MQLAGIEYWSRCSGYTSDVSYIPISNWRMPAPTLAQGSGRIEYCSWSFGHSDVSDVPILGWHVSPDLCSQCDWILSPSSAIRRVLYPNIEWHVSAWPMRVSKHWILKSGSSATPMFQWCLQYWTTCQLLDLSTQQRMTNHRVHLRPLRCVLYPKLLNDIVSPTWPMQSGIEYWVDLRPLRCFRCPNIEWHVSLTYAVRHWILGPSSATPMFPMSQYWMTC